VRYLFHSAIFLLLLLVGCTSFQGVRPDSPASAVGFGIGRVDSLTPNLSWQQAEGQNITYDLVLYEAIREEGYVTGGFWIEPGPRVYYRGAITGTSHRVETQLKPNTQYFWSVRVRQGQRVSRWSTYNYTDPFLTQRNSSFTFMTPKDEQ
jgi:hypothetical protein